MGVEFNPYIKQYVDSDTHQVVDAPANTGASAAGETRTKENNKSVSGESGGRSNGATDGAPTQPTGGGSQPADNGYDTYVVRNGQKIKTTLKNGQTYLDNGTLYSESGQEGDIIYTPQGGYYVWRNGKATPVSSLEDKEYTLSQLGKESQGRGYVPKGSPAELDAMKAYESWLKQNNPSAYEQYINNGIAWNIANSGGNTAGMTAANNAEETLRSDYGFVGGTDGTRIKIINPSSVPPDLVATFQPFIDEYNANLMANGQPQIPYDQFMSMLLNGYPVYNDPQVAASPDAQLTLMNLKDFPKYIAAQLQDSPQAQLALATAGQYPDFVRAVVNAAPQSNLAIEFSSVYPEYTVGEGMAPMDPLNYVATYMPEYWERFQNEYDPEKFAADYDAIRDQLIAANNAGVDLGRMKLQAQLENALPQYDELRAQNDIAKAKASNNMALYNQAQGDLGGIGSRRYSIEQNAYDQRMNEIQLEQQNLINTTNQQIAQLEAEGKMKEAELLAQWGQAKLAAMQEQYNLYWNLYQQGASAMENLQYGIASDDWDRAYKIRQDELQNQLNKYNADVNKFNTEFDIAKTMYDVDLQNYLNNYNTWRDTTNFNIQQAQDENAYLNNKYNAAVDQQKLQLDVDQWNANYNWNKWLADTQLAQQEAQNRNNWNLQARADELQRAGLQADIDKWNYDYDWNKWAADTNLAYERADAEYNRGLGKWNAAQELQQTYFNQAMQKLQLGLLGENDIKALGIPEEQAKEFADRLNLLAQIDAESAQQQLELLRKQVLDYSATGRGRSGGGGGGYGGGSNTVSTDTGLADWQLIEKMILAGVTPDTFFTAMNSGKFGKMLSNGEGSFLQMKEEFTAMYNKYMGIQDNSSANLLERLYLAGADTNNVYTSLLAMGYTPEELKNMDVEAIMDEYATFLPNRQQQAADLRDYLATQLLEGNDRADADMANNTPVGKIYVQNYGYVTREQLSNLQRQGLITASEEGGKIILRYYKKGDTGDPRTGGGNNTLELY